MVGKSAEEIRIQSLEKVLGAAGKPSYPARKRFGSKEELLARTAPKLARIMDKYW